MKKRNVFPLFASLLSMTFVLATQAVEGATLLNDNFDSPSYNSFSFNSADSSTNPDDVSSVGFTPVGAGGNPGALLEVDHFHDVDRDGFGEPINGDGSVSLQSFIEEQSVEYDASTNGAITDLTFQLDVLLGPPGLEGGEFGSLFFIVHDSGGGSAAGFTSLFGLSSGWNTITVPGLTNANFSSRDFVNGTDLGFGFGFTSFGDVFNAGETVTVQVDNFIVTANTIPEPSSLLLGTLATLGLLASRKRSR